MKKTPNPGLTRWLETFEATALEPVLPYTVAALLDACEQPRSTEDRMRMRTAKHYHAFTPNRMRTVERNERRGWREAHKAFKELRTIDGTDLKASYARSAAFEKLREAWRDARRARDIKIANTDNVEYGVIPYQRITVGSVGKQH